MNVHGTHASAGLTADVKANTATPKAHNDCQIQAAEFARMLNELMNRPEAHKDVKGAKEVKEIDIAGAPVDR